MKRPSWRVLVPALVALGLVGAAVPAFAGELDHDKWNNRLQVRMSFHCDSDGSVKLSWHSIWPSQATHMTAVWYDSTVDSDLNQAHSAGRIHKDGRTASGSTTIPAGHNRHHIWLFVDALDDTNNQVFGIGRNADVIHC